MPKGASRLSLNWSSLLGPLFFSWLLQLLLPLMLVGLVYEKEKRLRTMMKMHGLGELLLLLLLLLQPACLPACCGSIARAGTCGHCFLPLRMPPLIALAACLPARRRLGVLGHPVRLVFCNQLPVHVGSDRRRLGHQPLPLPPHLLLAPVCVLPVVGELPHRVCLSTQLPLQELQDRWVDVWVGGSAGALPASCCSLLVSPLSVKAQPRTDSSIPPFLLQRWS